MKKAYITAMCSEAPPGQARYLEAYKLADIAQDKKKHIRFQVAAALLIDAFVHMTQRLTTTLFFAD